MPINEIGLGTGPNTGTGEPARSAGQKINGNFLYLDMVKKPVDPFVWMNSVGGYVQKAVGNENQNQPEIGDLVWFKDVDHNGVTLTLMGWQYNGGDTEIKTSYTKIKSLI